MAKTIDLSKFVCTGEAGRLLGLSGDTVKSYCVTGRLKAIKWGRSWMVSKAELARYARIRRPYGNKAAAVEEKVAAQ